MTSLLAPATIEAKWRARVVPASGGHLDWTGSPWLRWDGRLYKPARVGFTIGTGRQPAGYVLPDCGHHGCVEPGHLLDQPGRNRTRQQLRALHGLPNRPQTCTHGHNQADHGRLDDRGYAYCNTCITSRGAA